MLVLCSKRSICEKSIEMIIIGRASLCLDKLYFGGKRQKNTEISFECHVRFVQPKSLNKNQKELTENFNTIAPIERSERKLNLPTLKNKHLCLSSTESFWKT